ncbi:hypothetical protein CK203_000081 [Vitis vinifera]|uniref:Uncharacterized protein n=1 Tax=Vitis vinifera TaxID=29760 RepID=A0A438KRP9_VITVI|nr:hypothetical protein CK203_000081 [Vitis vinifera]
MLENPSGTDPPSSVKQQRYAPPNQRNRSLNRRKSGGMFMFICESVIFIRMIRRWKERRFRVV